jgi:hypothetical protein
MELLEARALDAVASAVKLPLSQLHVMVRVTVPTTSMVVNPVSLRPDRVRV